MKVVTVGRSPHNDVVINDDQASRNHLQIIQDDTGGFRLADFGSSNGTFVNGKRVDGEISLSPNDIVRIGNSALPWKNYFDCNQGKTGVEVNTQFFPLAFFWFLCSPVIEFNGQKHQSSWGKHFFNLPVGQYAVTIYVPYMFWRRCGENSISVQVNSGETAKISFYAPLIVFCKGRMK